MYGSNSSSNKYLVHRLAMEDLLTTEGCPKVKSLYTLSEPIADAPGLLLVEAISEFMPHLISWAPVTTARVGNVCYLSMVRETSKYLANMLPDEQIVVAKQLHHIYTLYGIQAIDTYPDSFIVYVNINGVQRSMVVAVLNMIEEDSIYMNELQRRDTLN